MAHIVLIEDNPQSARMAAKLLRHAGHEVLVAEDGEDGLMTVFESKPDLVVTDLGLPDIDGQTIISLIRNREGFEDMPVIAFTAWPEEAALQMGEAYGFNGVILKPIDTRTFADQVIEFMTRKPSASNRGTA